MSSFHELTEILRPPTYNTLKIGPPFDIVDQRIRQWLEEKVEILDSEGGYSSHSTVRKILGLTEESLESKFKNTILPSSDSIPCVDSSMVYSLINRNVKKLAQIAKEHYEDKE